MQPANLTYRQLILSVDKKTSLAYTAAQWCPTWRPLTFHRPNNRIWGILRQKKTFLYFFIPAWRSISGVFGTATWLAGWLAVWVSVTRRYCIKTPKAIWKLFRPSESPIILVCWDPWVDKQFQGNPFSGGVKYTGWEKLAIFVRFSTDSAVYLKNGAR